MALPGDLLRQLGGDLLAVDRLDHIEQRHRFLRLVGLQRADQMQLDIGKFGLQSGPFALRFLHAVFAEHALPGLDDRPDLVGIEGLRHGDQRHRAGRPFRFALRRGDLAAHDPKLFNRAAHACFPHRFGPFRPPAELTLPAIHGEGPPRYSCIRRACPADIACSSLSEIPVMATERYNPRAAEPRWQKAWDEAKLFETKNDDPRPKYYVLEMFPYPSGRIHMGHVRNYTMGDVVARHRRALGYNVLHPMGWDAFGLPAENAARDRGVNPRSWTYQNIEAMKAQLKSWACRSTGRARSRPATRHYYKHQQKMFLDFWKAGLVERKSAKVNWDPEDMTVLANEQVIDGRGWRSGALVEQRDLTQWFFKITSMSQELLDSLETLDQAGPKRSS